MFFLPFLRLPHSFILSPPFSYSGHTNYPFFCWRGCLCSIVEQHHSPWLVLYSNSQDDEDKDIYGQCLLLTVIICHNLYIIHKVCLVTPRYFDPQLTTNGLDFNFGKSSFIPQGSHYYSVFKKHNPQLSLHCAFCWQDHSLKLKRYGRGRQ